ncbi:MAG: CRTAC1 family protein [Bryobacteraceae bacterium]
MKRLLAGLVAVAAVAGLDLKIPAFEDVSKKAGITLKTISGDAGEKTYLLESIGGGLAVIDYNNDGLMDLYVVNGTTIPRARAGLPPYPSALYRNNGDGTFTDIAPAAGLVNPFWGKGAIAFDFNGDGHTDIYVVNFGPNVLFQNLGNGTFRNVSKEAGVGDSRWSTAAAAADYDKDGDLDLFVANYLDYDLDQLPAAGKFCSYQNIPVACGPRGLKGSGDTLYRNNGDGTFTDVSVKAGVSDPEGYYSLATAWGDYDNDGDPDLFVANDSTPNRLYRNNGDGTFTDVAVETGVAFSEDGREQSCMGVEFEDLDNDGWLDIMVTNFSDDYNTLYRNSGKGFFRDDSHQAGLVTDTWTDLSWGVGFYDFNNDGWKDVFIANGHIYPQVDRHPLNTTYRQKNKLYLNTGKPRLRNVVAEAGTGLQIAKSFRGAAFADFNNDGKIDIAVGALDDTPSLLINRGVGKMGWLLLRLAGAGKNRYGIGARISVKIGDQVQIREVKAGGSYASSSDPRAHFGLGVHQKADEVEVRWPSGKVSKLTGVAGGSIVTIKE